jgi:hypothetical protein
MKCINHKKLLIINCLHVLLSSAFSDTCSYKSSRHIHKKQAENFIRDIEEKLSLLIIVWCIFWFWMERMTSKYRVTMNVL